MGFFSNLFHSRDIPQNRTAGSGYAFYFGGTTAGKKVTERPAMQMTADYSYIRILADAITGLPVHLYKYKQDGGHLPSEVLGNSYSRDVNQMYEEYVDGAVTITKAAATKQTTNGITEEATGTDISDWVNCEDMSAVSFTLYNAAAYRTKSASKATPGFGVIDYRQEDYVFGSTEKDARHWATYLL